MGSEMCIRDSVNTLILFGGCLVRAQAGVRVGEVHQPEKVVRRAKQRRVQQAKRELHREPGESNRGVNGQRLGGNWVFVIGYLSNK